MTDISLPKARDLYPKGWQPSEDLVPWPGYTPILNSFGEIICRVDIPDIGGHHGDTQVLLRKSRLDGDDVYGYLMLGWGSCSGCDALLHCNTYEEVDELIKSTYGSIRWFDDVKEAKKFFDEHEWLYDHVYSPLFVRFCQRYFTEVV